MHWLPLSHQIGFTVLTNAHTTLHQLSLHSPGMRSTVVSQGVDEVLGVVGKANGSWTKALVAQHGAHDVPRATCAKGSE